MLAGEASLPRFGYCPHTPPRPESRHNTKDAVARAHRKARSDRNSRRLLRIARVVWGLGEHKASGHFVAFARCGAASAHALPVQLRNDSPSKQDFYFLPVPHALDIASILLALSRIRAEAVGEFSLAIRGVELMDQSKSSSIGETARNSPASPTRSIVDTVIAEDHFTTFASAVRTAGLTDALSAKGPFTVFAPTNEAFKKLAPGAYDALLRDAGKLKAVLNYHVVAGYFMRRDIKSGEVMTVQGTSLTAAASSSDVRVNGARITKADIVATNGVVHAIDAVILPKEWTLLADAA